MEYEAVGHLEEEEPTHRGALSICGDTQSEVGHIVLEAIKPHLRGTALH